MEREEITVPNWRVDELVVVHVTTHVTTDALADTEYHKQEVMLPAIFRWSMLAAAQPLAGAAHRARP